MSNVELFPGFPTTRLRRLRRTEQLRDMFRETRLHVTDFIYPLFMVEGSGVRKGISSMPGQYQMSIDNAVRECGELRDLGITSVILFGIPAAKDEVGSGAYDDNGIIQKATREIKKHFPEMVVVTDVCLCEYTSHGHCGIVRDGEVVNDKSLDLLARTAVSQAEAGADVVAPSAMMDGQVGAIREALDEAGFEQVAIMAYAVKYASAFYGPFREAADSAPAFGDRRAYQMDAANAREALREADLDEAEGADMLMVKPATVYLDILKTLREQYDLPLAAYHVSGEYAMLKAAARNGWIDEQRAMMETLMSIKRAGADIILTYYAREAVRVLKSG
ncbi:MAG TPA: porphobilinogen synthase, partial [Pyrinomonadaceae bacterium]|nr:porphobilinogen synthase [Pyrinomonadaceae bacterium]